MTSLVKAKSQFQLTPERLEKALGAIRKKIKGRVDSAYVFGSSALGTNTKDSDIDLILIVRDPKLPFVQRGMDFIDLFDVYPHLDLLVYTEEELKQQLKDSSLGFWKSVRETMKRIDI